ncbi:hypothetical protein C8Q78DRAFT_763000 [Trametes maxima]|nr:hypothetical protein C8Q78DRAFT_763000 [Trametes maxima]
MSSCQIRASTFEGLGRWAAGIGHGRAGHSATGRGDAAYVHASAERAVSAVLEGIEWVHGGLRLWFGMSTRKQTVHSVFTLKPGCGKPNGTSHVVEKLVNEQKLVSSIPIIPDGETGLTGMIAGLDEHEPGHGHSHSYAPPSSFSQNCSSRLCPPVFSLFSPSSCSPEGSPRRYTRPSSSVRPSRRRRSPRTFSSATRGVALPPSDLYLSSRRRETKPSSPDRSPPRGTL